MDPVTALFNRLFLVVKYSNPVSDDSGGPNSSVYPSLSLSLSLSLSHTPSVYHQKTALLIPKLSEKAEEEEEGEEEELRVFFFPFLSILRADFRDRRERVGR